MEWGMRPSRMWTRSTPPAMASTQHSILGIMPPEMIPKMECCVDAINGGVERVHILDGRIPHSILIELLSDRGIGTMLQQEK